MSRPEISPELAAAMSEMMRLVARRHGIPDSEPIDVTICRPRDYLWCGVDHDIHPDDAEGMDR